MKIIASPKWQIKVETLDSSGNSLLHTLTGTFILLFDKNRMNHTDLKLHRKQHNGLWVRWANNLMLVSSMYNYFFFPNQNISLCIVVCLKNKLTGDEVKCHKNTCFFNTGNVESLSLSLDMQILFIIWIIRLFKVISDRTGKNVSNIVLHITK